MSARDEEFTAYVEARRTHLRRVAYALCGDWHRAEDLLQTALTKAYVAWPRIRRQGAEDAYVRRTMVRANIDESRRPWRRETVAEHLPEQAAPDPATAADEHDALFAALQALPEMQRKVVVLRHWLSLSVQETADELGISEGTVKSHSARGVARLQEVLSPGGVTPPGSR